MQQYIDGVVLNFTFTVGYRNLKKNVEIINDLNVFPVPDGDTGTNMAHTFGGGLGSVKAQKSVAEYMKSLSDAVLLNARGNSGVILSQFISGLYKGFKDNETICFADFSKAFINAKEESYKAVIKPAEGTILTIIREASDFLNENAEKYEDFNSGLSALIDCMKNTLAKTPEMLPVLKEAGVVDSGGAGLICIFEGMCSYFSGVSLEEIEDFEVVPPQANALDYNFGPDSVMEFGYCTEFILQLLNSKTNIQTFSKENFIKALETLGESIVCVVNESIVKVHIHTFTPEKVLAYARNFGEFVTMKIENMSVQHNETVVATKKEHFKYVIVAVASGEGIIDYFYSIGCTAVINGGQTNNPSVEDFIKTFDEFDAEHFIVLPNNSNIILTAEQAASIYNKSDVKVIPTKSIVEGYSALSMVNLWEEDVDTLINDMSSGLSSVISGYITKAIRDSALNGIDIKKDKYIGIKNKEILVCDDNRISTFKSLINQIMAEEEKEIIIVFYGKDISQNEIDELNEYLENEYPLVDVGFIEGKQDIYDYIISLE